MKHLLLVVLTMAFTSAALAERAVDCSSADGRLQTVYKGNKKKWSMRRNGREINVVVKENKDSKVVLQSGADEEGRERETYAMEVEATYRAILRAQRPGMKTENFWVICEDSTFY